MSVAAINNLQPGSYMISAKVVIQFNSAAGAQNICSLLVNGNPVDLSYANTSSPAITSETAKLLGVATFASATNSIVVSCTTNNGTATALNSVLTVMKVNSVTQI
jgi:hypothetical protein